MEILIELIKKNAINSNEDEKLIAKTELKCAYRLCDKGIITLGEEYIHHNSNSDVNYHPECHKKIIYEF